MNTRLSEAAVKKLDDAVSNAAIVTAACMLANANIREQELLKIVRRHTCNCATVSTDAPDHGNRCNFRRLMESLPS